MWFFLRGNVDIWFIGKEARNPSWSYRASYEVAFIQMIVEIEMLSPQAIKGFL